MLLIASMAASVFTIRAAHSAQFLAVGGDVGAEEYSEVQAVDSTGNHVVGTTHLVDGPHAFRWTPLGGTQLLDGVRVGYGISGDGEKVVGDGLNQATGVVEPVRWTSSAGVSLLGGPPGATLDFFTGAYDASFDGSVVVGQTKVSSSSLSFHWTPGDGSQLLNFEGPGDWSGATGVSDDGKTVVGVWDRAGAPSAGFRWTAAGGVVPLESPIPYGSSTATNISPDGAVVVGEAVTAQVGLPLPVVPQAFRWSESTGMVFLQNTMGGVSTAYGATQSGEAIVGTAAVRAFVWTELHGMERLVDVLRDRHGLGAQVEGWTLWEARDISADGTTIVGSGANPEGRYQAWVVRLDRPIFVPEPEADVMIVGALIGAMLKRRRAVGDPSRAGSCHRPRIDSASASRRLLEAGLLGRWA